MKSWNDVHAFYALESEKYTSRKENHALHCLVELTGVKLNTLTANQLNTWIDQFLEIKKDITHRIEETRAKDYANPFRKMVYENDAEMNAVVGALKDNGFIKDQNKALKQLTLSLSELKKQLKLK
jgi:hypothetical protein